MSLCKERPGAYNSVNRMNLVARSHETHSQSFSELFLSSFERFDDHLCKRTENGLDADVPAGPQRPLEMER